MTLLQTALLITSCLVHGQISTSCVTPPANAESIQAAVVEPIQTGGALDVVISAESALVWDIETGTILYEKNAAQERPIASINKLLSALVIRENTSLHDVIEIPPHVQGAQRAGADIRLIPGQHVDVAQLLHAGLVASANDAMVTLALAVDDSEAAFAERANVYAQSLGLTHTQVTNATGLSGGKQYSTTWDIKEIMDLVYADPFLRDVLNDAQGRLTTQEGATRFYETTNDLVGTYLPIEIAKTGYTLEAKENVVVVTTGEDNQKIGAIVLGSNDRFQDMKVLVEWIWQQYTWQ